MSKRKSYKRSSYSTRRRRRRKTKTRTRKKTGKIRRRRNKTKRINRKKTRRNKSKKMVRGQKPINNFVLYGGMKAAEVEDEGSMDGLHDIIFNEGKGLDDIHRSARLFCQQNEIQYPWELAEPAYRKLTKQQQELFKHHTMDLQNAPPGFNRPKYFEQYYEYIKTQLEEEADYEDEIKNDGKILNVKFGLKDELDLWPIKDNCLCVGGGAFSGGVKGGGGLNDECRKYANCVNKTYQIGGSVAAAASAAPAAAPAAPAAAPHTYQTDLDLFNKIKRCASAEEGTRVGNQPPGVYNTVEDLKKELLDFLERILSPQTEYQIHGYRKYDEQDPGHAFDMVLRTVEKITELLPKILLKPVKPAPGATAVRRSRRASKPTTTSDGVKNLAAAAATKTNILEWDTHVKVKKEGLGKTVRDVLKHVLMINDINPLLMDPALQQFVRNLQGWLEFLLDESSPPQLSEIHLMTAWNKFYEKPGLYVDTDENAKKFLADSKKKVGELCQWWNTVRNTAGVVEYITLLGSVKYQQNIRSRAKRNYRADEDKTDFYSILNLWMKQNFGAAGKWIDFLTYLSNLNTCELPLGVNLTWNHKFSSGEASHFTQHYQSNIQAFHDELINKLTTQPIVKDPDWSTASGNEHTWAVLPTHKTYKGAQTRLKGKAPLLQRTLTSVSTAGQRSEIARISPSRECEAALNFVGWWGQDNGLGGDVISYITGLIMKLADSDCEHIFPFIYELLYFGQPNIHLPFTQTAANLNMIIRNFLDGWSGDVATWGPCLNGGPCLNALQTLTLIEDHVKPTHNRMMKYCYGYCETRLNQAIKNETHLHEINIFKKITGDDVELVCKFAPSDSVWETVKEFTLLDGDDYTPASEFWGPGTPPTRITKNSFTPETWKEHIEWFQKDLQDNRFNQPGEFENWLNSSADGDDLHHSFVGGDDLNNLTILRIINNFFVTMKQLALGFPSTTVGLPAAAGLHAAAGSTPIPIPIPIHGYDYLDRFGTYWLYKFSKLIGHQDPTDMVKNWCMDHYSVPKIKLKLEAILTAGAPV